MLNWIAIWVGVFLFGLGGPLQNDTQPFVPVSNDVLEESKLEVFWGDPLLQGLHVGFFVALAALVVYWITLNRTTLGYEVRAVGFNPEAARYGGISVARNYFLAMAISGAFAGLAGRDRRRRLAVPDQHERRPDLVEIAFVGIAVALLGRNTAVGSRARGAALRRAHDRHVDAEPRPRDLPARAGVEPDRADPGPRRALRRRRRADPLRCSSAAQARRQRPRRRPNDRAACSRGCPRATARVAWLGDPASGSLAFWVALPPLKVREPVVADRDRPGRARARDRGAHRAASSGSAGARSAIGVLGIGLGYLATRSSVAHLDQVVVWSALTAAMLRYATPLAFAAMGGIFSERSGVVNIGLEGMMLSRRVLRHPRRRQAQLLAARAALRRARRRRCFALVHAFFAIHLRADQIVGGTAINFLALGITGLPLHRHLRRRGHAAGHPGDPGRPPRLPRGLVLHRAGARPAQPDDLARVPDDRRDLGRALQDADRPAHPRRRRAPARRRHGRDLRLRDPLRGRDALGRAGRARRRLPLDRVRQLVQPEHDRRGAASSRSPRSSSATGGRGARPRPRSCSASRARSPSACRRTPSRRRCSSRRCRTSSP